MIGGLAASTALFDGQPLDAALEAIAVVGLLREVELAFIGGYSSFDEGVFTACSAALHRQQLSAAGLIPAMVSAHLDLSRPEAAEALLRRIDFAAALGARGLITNAGPAAAADAIHRTLDAALPRVVDAGLMLALENPGHGVGDALGDLSGADALMRRHAGSPLGINLDLANVLSYTRGSMQPAAVVEAVRPWLVNLHLKDIRLGRDWRFTALGEGDVDLFSPMRLLSDTAVPAAIELPLHLERPAGGAPVRAAYGPSLDDARDALERSIAFLRRADAC